MPPAIQVKLLRVLQEQRVRAGRRHARPQVDVRVIAATNRDLARRSRRDGSARTSTTGSTSWPSCRRSASAARTSRCSPTHFLERYRGEQRRSHRRIHRRGARALANYDWPGNVRELENVIERAVVLTTGTQIEARHLPATVRPTAVPRDPSIPIIPGATMAELERYAILKDV